MKQATIGIVLLALLTGCTEKKDFNYWKDECSKDWKTSAFENSSEHTCSESEVDEYAKRKGAHIEE